MIITGTDNFQNICRQRLVEWYNGQDFGKREPITLDNNSTKMYIRKLSIKLIQKNF